MLFGHNLNNIKQFVQHDPMQVDSEVSFIKEEKLAAQSSYPPPVVLTQLYW